MTSKNKDLILAEAEDAQSRAYRKAESRVTKELDSANIKSPWNSPDANKWINYIASTKSTLPPHLTTKLHRREKRGLPSRFHIYTTASQRAELLSRKSVLQVTSEEHSIVSPTGGFRLDDDTLDSGITIEAGRTTRALNPPMYRLLEPFMPTRSRLSGDADVWWVISFFIFAIPCGLAIWKPVLGITLLFALVLLYVLGYVTHRVYLTRDDLSDIRKSALNSDVTFSPKELALLGCTRDAASGAMNTYAWKIGYMSDQNLDWHPISSASGIVDNILTLQKLRTSIERDPAPGHLERDSYEELFAATAKQVIDYTALSLLSMDLSSELTSLESRSKRSPSAMARAALSNAALSDLQREPNRDWSTKIAAHAWALREV